MAGVNVSGGGLKVTGCMVTTAGVTLDGKYSLAINEVNGAPCLCIHRCEVRDGLHFSSMDDASLVTAIGLDRLRSAVDVIQSPLWSKGGE